MDKIRLGNDIEMRWSIFTRDGDNKVPYNLEGRVLTLSVVNRTGESEIEFFAEGNIVTGVFRGRDQRILGKHGVILRENNGKDGMRTIDACDAFELVACSCEEALGSPGTIQLFHLTFDSTIGAITGTIDPILNHEAEQAEAERKANEIIRKANEQQRIDNEKQRNVNEILRNIAEEERERAEQERQVNEDLRKADEAERKTNEESRLQSESERISSEEERLYAESIRVANENARIASEAKRAEAETARVEAEDKRIVSEKNRLSAESSRIANEDSRRANEDSRLSAEAKRVSAETKRVGAEEERQIAEEERQAKFASMVVQTTGDATDKVMSQKAVTEALKGKQNKLTAGKGISIDGDVISATLDMDIVRVVDALPSVGEANIIYLVPAEQPSESDLFEEWVWTDRWERIGSAKIDLSDYATKTELATKQDALTDTDGSYGQRVAELEKKGIASQEKLTELEGKVGEVNDVVFGKDNGKTLSFDVTSNEAFLVSHPISLPRGGYQVNISRDWGGSLYIRFYFTDGSYKQTGAVGTSLDIDYDQDIVAIRTMTLNTSTWGRLDLVFIDKEPSSSLLERVSALESHNPVNYVSMESHGGNLINPSEKVVGYLNTNTGNVDTSITTREVCGYIRIDERGLYGYTLAGYGNNKEVCYYDSNKIFIGSANRNADGIIPYLENASYIRCTFTKGAIGVSAYIVIPDEPHIYSPYFEPINTQGFEGLTNLVIKDIDTSKPKYLQRRFNTLLDGELVTLEENNIKGNKHLVFNAKVGVLDKIALGHGTTSQGNTGTHIEIDSMNVYFYLGNESQPSRSLPHNVTIENNLQVSIDVDMKGNASVTIQSMGVSNTLTSWNWYGDYGDIFVESKGSSLTDCILSWTTDGYFRKIHLYGDSYFGSFNPDRWVSYLAKAGYANNALIDSFGGKQSMAAFKTFMKNLQHCTPKYAVWCMGMNDADTDSMISQTWLTATIKFISVCEVCGIKPILSTIPCVPGRNHAIKNAWVKSSGYRYIDFANAVNAENTDSTWYAGMLSSDNVHPNATGAKTLYMRFITDFPEIMDDSR